MACEYCFEEAGTGEVICLVECPDWQEHQLAQNEEYQKYLAELEEAATSLLNEEFEYFTLAPPTEDLVDDIPF